LGNPSIDGRTIMNTALRKQGRRVYTGFVRFRVGKKGQILVNTTTNIRVP
jgi:hypothetical protein